MLKEARFNTILKAVNAHKYMSLHALMELTRSSESTIRADLIELAKEGKLLRLRGGAQAINDETLSYELSVEDKMGIQYAQKKLIAQKAVTLIKPGMLIYMDAGTSTYALAEELNVPNVQVFTNSVLIARKVVTKGYKAYTIGGELKYSTDAFVGPMAEGMLSTFRFDLGFFGTNGVDAKCGCTTPGVEEASIKRKAISQCREAYILADSSKFDVVTAVYFHPFEPSHIITDSIHKEKYENLGILEAKE